MILVTLAAVVLSAFAYRVGGMSKQEAAQKIPWFPQVLVKGWFRDLNCTLLALGWALAFLPQVAWWRYAVAGVLMYAALTTYWDDSPLNWWKGCDNFYLHGFMIALAFGFIRLSWGLPVRCVALGLLMGVWCDMFCDVDVEELGRGAFIALTLPILFL